MYDDLDLSPLLAYIDEADPPTPEYMRLQADHMEALLRTAGFRVETLQPVAYRYESLRDVRQANYEAVVPEEMGGLPVMYFIGAENAHGEPRITLNVGNTSRSEAIATLACVALALVPAWIEILRGIADQRDAAEVSQPTVNPETDTVDDYDKTTHFQAAIATQAGEIDSDGPGGKRL